MKILCVEDGSVDIEKLENGEVREGKVLVYKQGSKPPFVLDIAENYNYEYSELNIKCDELQKENHEIIDKLGRLEDILEKYGVDIQNLGYILEDYSKNQGRDFAICEEMNDLKKDRDAWKNACKEACDVLRDINYKIYNEDRIDFENIFYQQAKKEKENETK